MVESFILFTVAGATYAVRSNQVESVEMVESITRVPRTAAFVEGVTSVRGQVIPVVSIRKRFDMEPVQPDLRSRLVVINIYGRKIGMIVDSAREFMKIDTEQIKAPAEALVGPETEYLEGVVTLDKRLILLINLVRLFDKDERNAIAEMNEFENPSQ
jgi:purine-binding chemotaxis protein CheW